MRWLMVVLLLPCLAAKAEAHSLSLAVLSVRQLSEQEFVTSWERLPGIDDPAAAYLLLRPTFPPHCRFQPPRLSCPGVGLVGRVGFAGLGELSASGMISIAWRRAPPQTFSLSAGASEVAIDSDGSAQSWARSALNLTQLGVEHILFGWDHLLFVLGLIWLVQTPGRLLKTITGFTLAHSVTLSAATLGWAAIPVAPVEAVIALSIVFVVIEAMAQHRGDEPSLAQRAPWLVALAFGLLHGFGFASALGELELAAHELPFSLLFFNLGVELGQLAFVALIWGARRVAQRTRAAWLPRATALLHYAAGTLASYWFIERIAVFW